MKTLLSLMLIHYYADGKRSTSAAITRKLDSKIRAVITADPSLAKVVTECKKAAEALKRQRRDVEKAHHQATFRRQHPGLLHVPCGKGRR
jgi:hypothetical protein